MYFIRITKTPSQDFERKTSLHQGPCTEEISKSDFANSINEDLDNIIEFEGCWCQILNGLCGYKCDSDESEEAIEELEEARNEGIFCFDNTYEMHLFEGEESDYLPDGNLFIPTKLIK